MKATVEKLENSFAHLSIEVGESRFRGFLDESYSKFSRQVRVPGFRKGKVPKQILEMRIGKETLIEDALKNLIPEVYVEAVEATGIDPLDEPDLKITEAEEGKPIKLTAKVLVRPEIKLPDYRQIRVEKEMPEVSDEDVDKQIQIFRENQATLVPVDHDTVADHDFVLAKINVTFEGQTIDLGIGDDSILVEAGDDKADFLGISRGVTGLKINDETEIEATLPEGFHQKEYAGKQVLVKIKIDGIRKKELPEVNDEFAKAFGDFQDINAMRQAIRENLEDSIKKRLEIEYINKVIDEISKETEVDVPEILVERQIDGTLNNLESTLAEQGLTMEGYLESCGFDKEDLRDNYRDDAYAVVKADLVLDAIAKAEGLEAADNEIDDRIRIIANYKESSFEDMKELLIQSGRIKQIENAIIKEKTRKRLGEFAQGG